MRGGARRRCEGPRARRLALAAGTLAAGACALVACRTRSAPGAPDARAADVERPPAFAPTPGATRVFVANHGKLVGAMNGFAWVSAGTGTHFETPDPCNETRCFSGADGLLCARGTIGDRAPPATGPSPRRLEATSGAEIGFDVRREGGAWGDRAPELVSIEYRSARGPVRLTAHVTGDPPDRDYCVEAYVSGEAVGARRFRTGCAAGSREELADFASVDKLALQIPASERATSFDLCITAIYVVRKAARLDAAIE